MGLTDHPECWFSVWAVYWSGNEALMTTGQSTRRKLAMPEINVDRPGASPCPALFASDRLLHLMTTC